ncbi:MAG: hypothetical protein KBT69_11405 [Oceanihabitans sp.]|jgi:hypothetical protein|nr:hypothetical protein [Oceanihabitans sp.]
MRITDTSLTELIEDTHIFEHGVYYFFKDFIISEVNEGVDYNWEVVKEIITIATKYYEKKNPICLISNRINQYSINPLGWHNLFKSGRKINGMAVVSYTENSIVSVAVEMLFFNSKLERFHNIFDAINWVKEVNLQQQNIALENK